jgi:DNA-binding CsgD family transcriptional regulator
MGSSSPAARREADLVRRCYAGLDGTAFAAEVAAAVRGLLPVDAVFFATADPSTLLFTGATVDAPLAAVTTAFLDNEYSGRDVNRFAALAIKAPHVATLDAATAGRRSDSPRYRDILAPMGLGDELRAALVTPAGCWGYLCLHRADSAHGFTPAEAALVGRIATHLGHGIRQSLTIAVGDPPAPTGAGVIVLHPDLSVAAMTGDAERWLATIAGEHADPGRLPMAVYAVAARLLRHDATLDEAVPPMVRVPRVDGGWLRLHAAHLGSDIAIIIEPAHAHAIAPLLLSSLGLTPRERDVALLVLRGASTRAIATALHLSDYTIKDYLKSIFDKTGVRSRRDLVGRLLAGQ